MPNQDIQATWHYHNGTKHPDGPLMDRWHFFDYSAQPIPFKIYPELEPIPLPIDTTPGPIPALDAISGSVAGVAGSGPAAPTAETLGKILFYSAGVTKTIKYSWGEMAFRAAACTGALYHIEVYLVCRDLPGLEAGVYHFDVHGTALKRLRAGDRRAALVEAGAGEPKLALAPAIAVYTDVRWRNACKYQAREYRHAFWDCGTMLANTLSTAASCGLPARVVLGFVDDQVELLLGLDPAQEVALALVPLGNSPDDAPTTPWMGPPAVEPLSPRTLPVSDAETDFPAILEMHTASSLSSDEEVAEWRSQSLPAPTRAPSGPVVPGDPSHADQTGSDPVDPDSIERVITRRGSTRRFSREPISFQDLCIILRCAAAPIPVDYRTDHGNGPGGSLNDLYLIVNDVDGLEPGAYLFHSDQGVLELLRAGDFRRHAGVLGLHQDLPADASVNVFFLCDLNSVLERFGNRGYRAAQMDASIAAGRAYLAAYALRLGATGLTFYDDLVTEFFGVSAQGKSAMFLVALGKRARRQASP